MVRPGVETVLIWLGAGVLLAGSVGVVSGGIRRAVTEARPFHWLVATAAGAAGLAYLAMALGVGTTVVPVEDGGVTVYWARYVAWVIAGPALLAALWLLAGGGRATLAALVGLAALAMVVLGAAALVTQPQAGLTLARTRLALWGGGTVLLILTLAVLIRGLSPQAGRQPRAVAVRFSVLRNVVVLLALLYPVAWMVGPLGLAIVGPTVVLGAYLVLDVLAVVGVGGLLLWDEETLGLARTGRESPTA